jgi:hypothetical protein
MGGTKKGRRLKVTSPECGLQTFSYYILLTPERARMTGDFSAWLALGTYSLIAHAICLSGLSFSRGTLNICGIQKGLKVTQLFGFGFHPVH